MTLSHLTHSQMYGIIAAAVAVLGLMAYFILRRRCNDCDSHEEGDANQVYVGNLPYRLRERELREKFEVYGPIHSLRLMKDRHTGRSKGFAFITFNSARAALQSQALHGQDFNGRALVVRPALKKSEK